METQESIKAINDRIEQVTQEIKDQEDKTPTVAQRGQHEATIRELKREQADLICRLHDLVLSPRRVYAQAMAARTVTSLMISNGAAAGLVAAGLFESEHPGLVIKHLLVATNWFLGGLLAAGFAPPVTAMTHNMRDRLLADCMVFGCLLISAVCLGFGLFEAHGGVTDYINDFNDLEALKAAKTTR